MNFRFPFYPFTVIGMALIGMTLITNCNQNVNSDQNNKMQKPENMDSEKLIIGTYTGSGSDASQGIYLVTRDKETGLLSFDSLLVEIENPTFQAITSDGRFLFSVSETSNKGGTVYSYAIQPDRSLKVINSQPTLGKSACHVAVNEEQTMLFVANYTSGVFTYYHLSPHGEISEPVEHYEYEGSGPHPNQNRSHPHQAMISPDQKYVYVPDLGTDQIHMYLIEPYTGKLKPLNPAAYVLPPGSGPRHMTFHPSKPYAYVINELGNTIQAMLYDEKTGLLSDIGIYSTLPEDFNEVSYCADIHISPDGKYLYGSNRGHNSLVIFKIIQDSGKLERVGFSSVHGDWPRNFYISHDGKFVYVGNQKTGNIAVFSRDFESGQLQLIDSTFSDTFSPVCINRISNF